MNNSELTFKELISSIRQIHFELEAQVGKAVNISLTLRNWIIGYYIRNYEQNGSDRAEYGEQLLLTLSNKLVEAGMERVSDRELRRYRAFTMAYPQIWESPTPKLQVPSKQLVEKLSFTHLAELIKIRDDLKRTFYEIECIKGCWSVRELKRQIAILNLQLFVASPDQDGVKKEVPCSTSLFGKTG